MLPDEKITLEFSFGETHLLYVGLLELIRSEEEEIALYKSLIDLGISDEFEFEQISKLEKLIDSIRDLTRKIQGR